MLRKLNDVVSFRVDLGLPVGLTLACFHPFPFYKYRRAKRNQAAKALFISLPPPPHTQEMVDMSGLSGMGSSGPDLFGGQTTKHYKMILEASRLAEKEFGEWQQKAFLLLVMFAILCFGVGGLAVAGKWTWDGEKERKEKKVEAGKAE